MQRNGRSSMTEGLSGTLSAGQALSSHFARGIATASLATAGPTLLPLSASVTYGRTNADAAPFEQFALGGGVTPLLDHALLSQRVTMPVLPVGVGVGSAVFTYRAAMSVAPFSWYYWGGSTARAGSSFSVWHRVIGAELSQSTAHIPMAGTPAARGIIGVGESLDAPFRKRLRMYAGLVLNP
jgi:hypothetical protein